MKRFLFLILAILSPLALRAQIPNQMVTLSSNGKYLVNSITGQPVFIVGDDAFDLCCMLDSADVTTYLTDRANQGFNAIWMAAVDNGYSSNPPKNFNGNSPFDGADFTNFDASYWANIDSIIKQAGSLGITVFLNPVFPGNGNEPGYLNSMLAASDATMSAYGTFLGQRYKGYNNIVWLLGGDAVPTTSGLFQKIDDLGSAIAAADPNHLITLEACDGICTTNGYNSVQAYQVQSLAVPSWLTLNWAHAQLSASVGAANAAYNQSPFLPPLCGENYYELEHSLTESNVRFEEYTEILAGCYVGRIFGNGAIWSFDSRNGSSCCTSGSPTWQSQLSSAGSISQENQGRLFRSREHWLLVPDMSHTVVTAGYGSGLTMTTAARTSDGQTVIAYLPDGNATAKTISMSSIVSSSSTAIAWWYAPLTGVATLIGTFPNSGSQDFTAPDGNDWVLVIDDAAANLGAPGGGTGNNPVPNITSLSPSSATAGGPAFTLTVNGSGFISSSVVNFNGSARTTTFVSASQIKAAILASDIATSGNANVTVANPAPGGGTTPNFAFTISSASNPVPTLGSISPTSSLLGQSVALTLNGTNFISSSVVNFGSNQNTGGVVSNGGDTLTITIPAAQLTAAGPVNVTVTNPAPGGGTSAAQVFTTNNPAPVASSLSPASAIAGGAGFTLTVNGSGFASTSVVKFNGAARTTTFVNATQISAAITAADIATAGTVNVAVTNPAPGGGTSANLPFTINNSSSLTITSLSPASTTTGGAGFTLTVNGTGFANGASVQFNGTNRTTTFVSGTQVSAAITAADIATAGTVNVTVTNPAPGGGTSNAQTFTINNPVPTEISIAPPSATAGGAAFTLTVNGTGFVSGSVVKVNGAAKVTTFVSATQVTAAIAAADIATAGTVNVAVTNPAPGGGTSGNIQFTISNANVTVTSLSPTSASAGGAAFTLTINGTGFATGATVNFGNNPAITPSSVTSTQILATVPAADITTGGTANVTVTNPPPGGISSAQIFTINNPAPTASSLSPTSATAGSVGFKLTVNGTGFVSGSVVSFNGGAKTTTFVSATQITAAITAGDIATAGAATVLVTNPMPGGGTSGSLPFAINNPSNVTITSLSPASATAGGAAFTLTVTGTGFVNGATVQFNGTNQTTTFLSSTQVTAAITAADIATVGTASVTVTNPTPGGGTSNAQTFTINNPSSLAITSLSPSSANAGGAAFALTVNGTGFVSGSVVNFSGVAKATTFKSATQLTAAISASDIATGGVPNVTVTNPAPGGGTSNAATFTVNNAVPALNSLSPSGVFAGSGAFTLTVNGTGFVNGATVQFNGSTRITTFVSITQVTAAILASDIAAAGTANVTVTNPAPTTGPSASLPLNVSHESNPVPAISTLGTNHVTGGAAFTLTVNGSNFVAKSIVNLNGKAEITTFMSAKTLSAAIPASDVAVAGSMNVTVTNPAPGGGTSPAFTLFVDGYTVTGTSTASVASGQPATLQITVAPTGNGFANPVTFSISGLPSGVTSLFSPSSVTPNAKPATTMLTITDGGAAVSRSKSQAGVSGGSFAPWVLLPCMVALLAWFGFEMRSRSIPQMRRYATVGLFVFMLFAGSVLGGCAVGLTSSPGSRTSQVTVTATSGTLTQTFGITLTVTR